MSKKSFIYEFRTRRVRRSGVSDPGAALNRRLCGSADVAAAMTNIVKGEAREIFASFYLDVKGSVIGYEIAAIGSLYQVDVHPRNIFVGALAASAASVVVAHNHPSGNVVASEEDINITKRLVMAGRLIGIPVMDHVIVNDDGDYYSAYEHMEIFNENTKPLWDSIV